MAGKPRARALFLLSGTFCQKSPPTITCPGCGVLLLG